MPTNYEYLKNPIVTIHNGGISLPNTLIGLGADVNVMNTKVVELLGLANLRPTAIVLELANRLKIQPKGILENVIILVEFW